MEGSWLCDDLKQEVKLEPSPTSGAAHKSLSSLPKENVVLPCNLYMHNLNELIPLMHKNLCAECSNQFFTQIITNYYRAKNSTVIKVVKKVT